MKILVNGTLIVEVDTVEIVTTNNRIIVDGVAETMLVNDKDQSDEFGTTHLISDLVQMDVEQDDDDRDDDDGELARDHLLARQELEDFEGDQFNDMYDNGDF